MNVLLDLILGPEKEKLKNNLLMGMDSSARILVVTRRIAETLNIFDSSTYADILNRYAEKHYNATKNMDLESLMAYMSEHIKDLKEACHNDL